MDAVFHQNFTPAADTLEIPAAITDRSETVIRHKGFTLSYNQDWKIPNWVAYELTAEEAEGTEPRSTTFTIDPSLASFQSATAADYINSGFDRGHMAPAADMSWSAEAMRESFYTTNICPQNPALNRGAWKSLETKVKEVAKEHGRVFVVCGPIVEDEHKTIGQNKVTVPNYFFKVLLLVDGSDIAAIGFIYPNMKCNYPTSFYAKSVDRNIERFPEDFMFQLTWNECENLKSQFATSSLRSQFVTLNSKQGQHIKYLPYAFTEQGVAMLSGVLHSQTAIEANIRIMRAFVGMRHFINENAKLFQRIENIEYHQLEMKHHQNESDKKIDELFDRLEKKEEFPPDGIFFDGKIFDAYVFVSNLIKKAKSEIILIDNYVDETVLNVLSKRNENVNATIYTARISHQFQLDLDRYNSQYQPITVNTFNRSHDWFLIIDDEVYHIGASLKDLGKKWFAFSILNFSKEEIVGRLA